MPGDTNKNKDNEGTKTVQSLLAPQKNNQGNTAPPKSSKSIKGSASGASTGKDSKVSKRTHSDVAEDSVENIDILSIHSDLVK